MQLERFRTSAAPPGVLDRIRALLDAAYADVGDPFTDEDWDHTLGGWHVVAWDGDALAAHGAVTHRRILVEDEWFDAGYVEGVATDPALQSRGFGSSVMADLGELVRAEHELGALSTGDPGFYERSGWERWEGPTFVVDGGERRRTIDEDGGILVLRFGRSTDVDLSSRIACEARHGDDW